jgi:hypothetical protein
MISYSFPSPQINLQHFASKSRNSYCSFLYDFLLGLVDRMHKPGEDIIPIERITNKIYLIREQHVLLDQDLAELYGVETKHLVQAVKRNSKRFPKDFMFGLSSDEFKMLRSQIVTSNRGGRRYPPYVFTEQGIAMLSSVLQSERAIVVNIAIMRTFVQLRKLSFSYFELVSKIEQIERKYDRQFKVIFDVIRKLIEPPSKPKSEFGFRKS